MASYNNCQFIGNLGRDPEMRFMPNGEAVANFSIACTETWKNKAGEKQESTEWVNMVAYGKVAEIAGKHLKKGNSVFISGKMKTRKWQDKNTGQDRYTTEIIVGDLKMLGGKTEGASQGGGDQQQQQRQAPAQSQQKQQAADFDDDIPF